MGAPPEAGIYRGFTDILQRALEREEARRINNYAESDSIREELARRGVRLDDRQHQLTTSNGLRASYSLQVGITMNEAQLMCLDREEARKENNYSEADRIRAILGELGIACDDKNHTFTMQNGQRGSYDLRRAPPPGTAALQSQSPSGLSQPTPAPVTQSSAMRRTLSPVPRSPAATRKSLITIPVRTSASSTRSSTIPIELLRPRDASVTLRSKVTQDPPDDDDDDDDFRGYFDALSLAMRREEARAKSDYAGSDRMRLELRRRGAEVDDRTHTFTLRDMYGTYDRYTGITPREVQYVALEREQARRDRDYEKSDQLREWLATHGVQVDDKAHIFSVDGVVGSFDLYTWTPVQMPDTNGSAEPDVKRQRRL